MTDDERIEFLTAYEELGPGGLTGDEQNELNALRFARDGDDSIVFDDIGIADIELGNRLKDILEKLRYMTMGNTP